VTTSIFIGAPFLCPFFVTNSQVALVVSGFLVERVPLVLDVGSVHAIHPIARFDFFQGDRNGLFSVAQNLRYISGYCLGQTGLLLFRFAGPQLDDDMRHLFASLLMP
jgi:hypothetical protein